MKIFKSLLFVVFGIGFGIVLTKSEVISAVRVHRMFAFQELHMFLVIGAAVVTGVVTTFLLKRIRTSKTDVTGEKMEFKERPFQPGIVFGGLMFGVGWYLTGACPGPVYALLGAGIGPAVAIFVGALVGAFLFGLLKKKPQ